MPLSNFKIFSGEADDAISIMREVAQWCEDTGKSMWKLDKLTKDKLMKGLKEENFCIGKIDSTAITPV
ncbi:MAG: hypothetical protein HPY66_2696 [Firmicutes bacterium]|nr:hypothetical protein [Bacillota bacterium]